MATIEINPIRWISPKTFSLLDSIKVAKKLDNVLGYGLYKCGENLKSVKVGIMETTPMTIGGVAKMADVNVETIRYYQRRGLIIEPPKPMYGFRHYSVKTISRIRFIKRAKKMGFKLREIEELLKLDDGHCEDARALAEQKCLFIGEQIEHLIAMREILKKLIDGCHTHPLGSHCPIIEGMDDNNIES